jgi:hypothetical protein
MKLWVLALTTA